MDNTKFSKDTKLSKVEEPRLEQALDQAVQWLLEHQDVEGWWGGELETNVTMTAEHVLLLRFLELSMARLSHGAIRYMLSHQRADVSFVLHFHCPPHLRPTNQ